MKKLNGLLVVALVIGALTAIPAAAATWYVTPDGGGDGATIQECLDGCAEGDTVLAAAGTYHENLIWPATQGIVLTSESGAEATIIDGGGVGRVITMTLPLDATTGVSYLTIQNGYVTGSGVDAFGGGILCGEGASPTITGNIITANAVGGYLVGGGGIGCFGSAPVIIGNTITYNEVSYGNLVGGAGIGMRAAQATVVGNHIAFNTIAPGVTGGVGGGIGAVEGSTPLIEGNTVASNTGGVAGGGIYFEDSVGTAIGNTIRLNTAENGAGIYLFFSSTTISNNLITTNSASVEGGGIKCSNPPAVGSATIYNNEIIHNASPAGSGGGIHLKGASPTIERCNIQGNGIGIYCETGDSEFSEPLIRYNYIHENSEFGLVNTNPYITVDAIYNWWGDPSGPHQGILNPGGLGDAVSVDVLFDPWLIFTDVGDSQPPAAVALAQNYPNPFNPRTTIAFSLDRDQWARLGVYELSGRRVTILAERDFVAGQHTVIWNGQDAAGRAMPSGVYFLRLETEIAVETRKAVLLR